MRIGNDRPTSAAAIVAKLSMTPPTTASLGRCTNLFECLPSQGVVERKDIADSAGNISPRGRSRERRTRGSHQIADPGLPNAG